MKVTVPSLAPRPDITDVTKCDVLLRSRFGLSRPENLRVRLEGDDPAIRMIVPEPEDGDPHVAAAIDDQDGRTAAKR